MKKLVICILIVCTVLCVFGCGGEREDRVSYKQTSYLVGSVENFSVTVVSGKRESPYLADGERGELVEFCIVTLKPHVYSDSSKTYTYRFEIDGETYDGTLNKDTFGSTLSRDVGKDIGENITAITFSDGEGEFTVSLENMVCSALISGDDALKIAHSEFEEKLEKEQEEGVYREVYLKFVSDVMGKENVYYWYVAFVGKNNDYSAVLIDVVSGEVVAKRN